MRSHRPQRLRVDGAGRRRLLVLGQKLERADTIPANGGQQTIGIVAICPNAAGDTTPDILTVWQKIVENCRDRGTGIATGVERQ